MSKGPFSYSGNKTRIYNAYLKPIMRKYNRIHEPFVGSGVCMYNANNGGMSTDVDPAVVAMHNALLDSELPNRMQACYNKFFATGHTKESYNTLREAFNTDWMLNGITPKNVHQLYVLAQISFNSLIRFSKNGFNVPFGEKPLDIERIKLHVAIYKTKDIQVTLSGYNTIDLNKVDKDRDIIYLDPPYIASKFQYGGWNKKDEKELLDFITKLDQLGYNFILSNTFSHKGEINTALIDWAKDYNAYLIDMSYNAWSARVTSVEREDQTVEVLITNLQDGFNDLANANANKLSTTELF